MKQRNRIIEVYGLWLADLLCIWATFMLATFIRHPNIHYVEDITVHYQVGVLFLLFCTVYNFILDWNHDFLKRRLGREIMAIFQYLAFMLLIVISIMTFLKWADIFSRLILIYFGTLNFIFTMLVHLLIKKILLIYYASDKTVTKVMVIAKKASLEDTVNQLKDNLSANYQITALACLDIDCVGQSTCDIPIIAGPDNLLDISIQMAFDEVFINAPEISQSRIGELMDGFDDMGINCHYNLAFAKKGADFTCSVYRRAFV